MRISAQDMGLVALFAALTAIGAWITIKLPFTPIPVTFQVLFVLLAGATLGSFRGALSQVVYVLLGVIGVPVFAGGTAGIGVVFGPTGGYLIGFVIAAFVVGLLVELRKDWGIAWVLFSTLVGVIVIYIAGMFQLALVNKLTLLAAFLGGVVPFIAIDLFKAGIAAVLTRAIRQTGVLERNEA